MERDQATVRGELPSHLKLRRLDSDPNLSIILQEELTFLSIPSKFPANHVGAKREEGKQKREVRRRIGSDQEQREASGSSSERSFILTGFLGVRLRVGTYIRWEVEEKDGGKNVRKLRSEGEKPTNSGEK